MLNLYSGPHNCPDDTQDAINAFHSSCPASNKTQHTGAYSPLA